MPGVGKSYWAEQIATHYSLQCIDLDDIIEVRTGNSIGHVFEQLGEAAFRKLEQETLQQVMQVFASNTVVACGGGTPCFYDNLERMKVGGRVIYLQASLRYLAQNLENELQSRPLLQQPDWQGQLADMYQKRKEFYVKAHHTLMAQSLSIKDFKALL